VELVLGKFPLADAGPQGPHDPEGGEAPFTHVIHFAGMRLYHRPALFVC